MKTFNDLYPGWTITGLKFFRGNEGDGFNAKLLKDGKPVVFVIDDANGGCYDYEPIDKEWKEKLDALVELRRADLSDKDDENGFNERKSFDMDWLVSNMTSKWEFEQKIRRAIKKKICFQLPEDGDKQFSSFSRPYTPETKAMVLKKYPTAVILNEVLR